MLGRVLGAWADHRRLGAWADHRRLGAWAEHRIAEAWAVHRNQAGQGWTGSLGPGPPGRMAPESQGMLLAAEGNVEVCV